MLVIRTNRDVPRSKQKRILVSNFTLKLLDKKLAIYFATVNPTSSTEAERIATSGNAMIAKLKAWQRYEAYCSVPLEND